MGNFPGNIPSGEETLIRTLCADRLPLFAEPEVILTHLVPSFAVSSNTDVLSAILELEHAGSCSLLDAAERFAIQY